MSRRSCRVVGVAGSSVEEGEEVVLGGGAALARLRARSWTPHHSMAANLPQNAHFSWGVNKETDGHAFYVRKG